MPAETVEIHGHIIDSLILPKVLDEILNIDGSFEIEQVRIGKQRTDPSYARVHVEAATAEQLNEILHRIKQQGAELVHEGNVRLAPAMSIASGADTGIPTRPRASFLDSRNTIREASG